MTKALKRIVLFFTVLLCFSCLLSRPAQAKTVGEWLEGYETGEVWFGDDFAYDITDTEACWELLMKPITVLDAGEHGQAGRHHQRRVRRRACAWRGRRRMDADRRAGLL